MAVGPGRANCALGPGAPMAEKRSASQSEILSPPKRQRLADHETGVVAPESRDWTEMIENLRPAIVALRVTHVRSFEEDRAAMSLGTGFVVDVDKGIILTNRHITGVGPVRAMAIFDTHEELEVEVLYRDPVHDFGFFRYDPKALRLTHPAQVVLNPSGLQVGTEIRVVGNDAGEKLQILSGTIARVDRNVPEFGTVYNDENTFYAGAGAGTSGGSSGSPVVDKYGQAVALNAAGQEGTACAYFLPLDRVDYSLKLLQANEPVPRGTVLASLHFKPFDDLARVGLQNKHEEEARAAFPNATGMLIVDNVLCEQEVLRPGDILVRLEGKILVGFADFEAALDARVGSSVKMCVCRGGTELQMSVPVRDFHALVPRSLFELGLDTLHDLGYHAAKRFHMPLESGVYLARSGCVFDSLGCQRGALITSVNKKATPSLEAFVDAITKIPDREYFPVSWYELRDFRKDRTLKTGFAKMSCAWSPLRLWKCSYAVETLERWECADLQAHVAASRTREPAPIAGHVNGGDPLVRRLHSSLVGVRFRTDRRFCTQASSTGNAEGFGLLVDAEQGLVLTDRHCAPQSLGDVEVSLVGGCTSVDAEVVFIHPLHNIALVRFDSKPLLKAKLPLRSASLAKGAKAGLRAGEEVFFVGYDGQGNTFSARVTVAAVYLPSGKDEFPMWDIPRFRERNLEIVVLADTPEDARGGVLCDGKGVVRALFAAFDWQNADRSEACEAFGIPVEVFAPLLDTVRRQPDTPPEVRSLDVEVTAVDVATLARGSENKLPKNWLQTVGRRCGLQGKVPRAIRVHRILPTGAADGLLKPGDVLLSVNGHHIACSLDIEVALQQLDAKPSNKAASKRGSRSQPPSKGRGASSSSSSKACPRVSLATIRVLREGTEVEIPVVPTRLCSEDDERLVIWAGLVFRAAPRSVLERCGADVVRLTSNVFAQNVLGGSPADSRDLFPHWFLLELDGHPIKQLGDFISAISKSPASVSGQAAAVDSSRRWVRLRFLDFFGQEHVMALQLDPLFFPTLELRRSVAKGGARWQCRRL